MIMRIIYIKLMQNNDDPKIRLHYRIWHHVITRNYMLNYRLYIEVRGCLLGAIAP